MNPCQGHPSVVVKMAAPDKQQIGSARMEQDGTIIVRVRMVGTSTIGDAEIRYVPGSAYYDLIRKRLPSLTTAHSVPVFNDWQ